MKQIIYLLLILSVSVNAQQMEQVSAFLDCNWYCDDDYIQTEIPFVNFIREPKDAQVHILVSRNTTGSGGSRFTFRFVGQKDFIHINDTLQINLKPDATDDETRIAQVEILKNGLFDFVKHSSVAKNISIVYEPLVLEELSLKKDPWNYWIFRLGANGRVNGEESYKSENINLRFSANRISESIKLENSFNIGRDKSIFNYEDIKLTTIRKTANANLLAVASINEHISVGANARYQHSTYSNINHGIAFMPAVEYNIYPYSEATEHQLRFLYGIGNQNNKYIDTTIFFKTHQNYFYHQLSIDFESMQKWGSIDLGLTGKDLFLRGNKYDISLYLNVDVRVIKGLNIFGWGSFNLNRSQIELPSSGSNYEEVLLRQKQLASSYNYYTSIGLSYTFGSLYNNIVNTRFD